MTTAPRTDQQRQSLLIQNNTLLRAGMWTALAAFFCLFMSQALFFIVMAIGMVIGIAATIWRLFGILQMRTSELILLVALLGNAFGIGWSTLLNPQDYDYGYRYLRGADATIAFGFLMLVVTLWILGGAASGLQIAQRLKIEAARERLWLMILFILYPAGITSVIVCAFGLLAGLAGRSPGVLAVSFLAGTLGVGVWCLAREYRQLSRL
jgi:hypothetical protein